jgi:hypothetical protein
MEAEKPRETVALRTWVEGRRIWLELADGRIMGFPASKYPLLGNAPQELLGKITLNGLALRWEELDEDIWVDDAVCGRFPRSRELAA